MIQNPKHGQHIYASQWPKQTEQFHQCVITVLLELIGPAHWPN